MVDVLWDYKYKWPLCINCPKVQSKCAYDHGEAKRFNYQSCACSWSFCRAADVMQTGGSLGACKRHETDSMGPISDMLQFLANRLEHLWFFVVLSRLQNIVKALIKWSRILSTDFQHIITSYYWTVNMYKVNVRLRQSSSQNIFTDPDTASGDLSIFNHASPLIHSYARPFDEPFELNVALQRIQFDQPEQCPLYKAANGVYRYNGARRTKNLLL